MNVNPPTPELQEAFAVLRAQAAKGESQMAQMARAFNRWFRADMVLRRIIPVVRRPLWPRGFQFGYRVRWWHWFRRAKVREWRAMCAEASEFPGAFTLRFCL